MIQVLVCDDHPVVRAGIAALLGYEADITVVATADSGEEALELLAKHPIDVVLMDLRMPGIGGVSAIESISRKHPAVNVLVLTTYDTDNDILAAISAGAGGYLLKAAPAEELIAAVRAVAKSETVLSPTIAKRLAQSLRTAPVELTTRELAVLQQLAHGLENIEIAKALFISSSTVKTHLVHIFEKLQVTTRTRAVTRAQELGLL